MAVEHVTILDTGTSSVRIRARDARHCGRCAMKSGCGHQLLSETFSRNKRNQAIELPLAPAQRDLVRPGETATLAIDETRLMILSLLHYGIPVLCLLLATAFAQRLAGEGTIIVSAAIAFAAGLALVGRIAGALDLPVTLAPQHTGSPQNHPIPHTRKSP